MGTEALWVPLALAAVSGGAQYANASNAASRANNAEGQSIADQAMFRNQANGEVQKLTQQIANNQPNALTDQAKTAFVNTLRQNAAGSFRPVRSGANNTSRVTPIRSNKLNSSATPTPERWPRRMQRCASGRMKVSLCRPWELISTRSVLSHIPRTSWINSERSKPDNRARG